MFPHTPTCYLILAQGSIFPTMPIRRAMKKATKKATKKAMKKATKKAMKKATKKSMMTSMRKRAAAEFFNPVPVVKTNKKGKVSYIYRCPTPGRGVFPPRVDPYFERKRLEREGRRRLEREDMKRANNPPRGGTFKK